MDPLTPLPSCAPLPSNLSLEALGAMVVQMQHSISCLAGQTITTDSNLRQILNHLESLPRPAVCPTSIICVNDVIFGYTADAGDVGAAQTALSNVLKTFDPRAVFFAGDNVYDAPDAETVAEAWLVFRWLINTQRAFYSLGNHDLDGDVLGSYTTGLFQSYINGLRYYGKAFSDADMAAWFYNTGYDTSGVQREPDLVNVGSVQHAWLQQAIRESAMGTHLLVQHHPPVSIIDVAVWGPDLQPENLGVKLVLCGHSHANEHIIYKGVHYLNLSTATQDIRINAGDVEVYDSSGVITDNVSFQWGNVNYRCCGRITARQRDILVEVIRISNGTVVHEFRIPRAV